MNIKSLLFEFLHFFSQTYNLSVVLRYFFRVEVLNSILVFLCCIFFCCIFQHLYLFLLALELLFEEFVTLGQLKIVLYLREFIQIVLTTLLWPRSIVVLSYQFIPLMFEYTFLSVTSFLEFKHLIFIVLNRIFSN